MREMLAIDPTWYEGHREHIRAWLRAGGVVDRGPEAAARLIPVRRGMGTVAVIPVTGFLTRKPTLFSAIFGGTSLEAVAAEVETTMRDSAISAVVLAVDSPGGVVQGTPEAAAKIRASRGSKPLFAVADPFAASAAYWLASQADELVGVPSSITGSIGVMLVHHDMSAALEKEGLKVSVFSYGKNKASASGDPAVPLDDEAREAIQEQVDYFGRMFEADVAKGRRVSVEKVRSEFGQGATFTGEAAVKAGVIDRIDMLDNVIRQAASGRRPESMGPAPRAYDPVELAAHSTLAGLDRMR